MSEYTEEITPERRETLVGAALSAIAWELVDYETDTSDRGVSEANYRNAVERAKTILPTLLDHYTSKRTVEAGEQ